MYSKRRSPKRKSKSRRNCNHGKLKSPVRLLSGHVRYCKKSPKRKSPKRKSPKRKSPKRKSPKRKSPSNFRKVSAMVSDMESPTDMDTSSTDYIILLPDGTTYTPPQGKNDIYDKIINNLNILKSQNKINDENIIKAWLLFKLNYENIINKMAYDTSYILKLGEFRTGFNPYDIKYGSDGWSTLNNMLFMLMLPTIMAVTDVIVDFRLLKYSSRLDYKAGGLKTIVLEVLIIIGFNLTITLTQNTDQWIFTISNNENAINIPIIDNTLSIAQTMNSTIQKAGDGIKPRTLFQSEFWGESFNWQALQIVYATLSNIILQEGYTPTFIM